MQDFLMIRLSIEKLTDEGLGKVGKFRIVRRIKNLMVAMSAKWLSKKEPSKETSTVYKWVGFWL